MRTKPIRYSLLLPKVLPIESFSTKEALKNTSKNGSSEINVGQTLAATTQLHSGRAMTFSYNRTELIQPMPR